MNDLFRSFYSRLSLLFLLLILVLGGTTLVIAFNSSGHLFDNVEQELNRQYAASLAVELQPYVTDEIDETKIKETIHYLMVVNPSVEIYLISRHGNVLAYFTGPGDMVKRHKVDMEPVLKFIYSNSRQTVLGIDPRSEEGVKPFSAAPMKIAGDQGYIYVILRGRDFDRSLEMIRNSYYLRTGFFTLLLVFIATFILGLMLFSLLTRRLRRLGEAVKSFETGDYSQRVTVSGTDEIAALGRTFNDMAQSVENSIQQRNDLIANISHDLRSPLTSIRGHLETVLLKDDRLTREERREYLEASLKSVSAFQTLVEQLFELSRLENREYKGHFETFFPAELAQDVMFKLKARAEAKGIDLSIQHSERNSPYEGDIALMERALTNLLENALNYSNQGDRVILSLAEEEGELTIRVEDTGEGIPEEDLPRIFERFYRADKSRDRRLPGTGLGLAIVKEIVELHNGSVSVESREGEGTAFTLLFPLSLSKE